MQRSSPLDSDRTFKVKGWELIAQYWLPRELSKMLHEREGCFELPDWFRHPQRYRFAILGAGAAIAVVIAAVAMFYPGGNPLFPPEASSVLRFGHVLFFLALAFDARDRRVRAIWTDRAKEVALAKMTGDGSTAWSAFKPRIDWWRQRSAAPPRWSGASPFVVMLSFTLGLATISTLFAVWPWALIRSIGWVFVLVMWLGSLGLMIRSAKRRALATLNEGHCPHCRYDLVGSEPAFADQTSIGPERCPECGYDWPFVPPPIPREFGTDRETD